MKTRVEPELDEIRRIRQEIMKECDYDVNKLHAYYEGLSARRIKAEVKAARPARKVHHR